MRLPCVFLSVLMEEIDSCFAPQKYPNEAGAHLARGMAEGQRGGSPIPLYIVARQLTRGHSVFRSLATRLLDSLDQKCSPKCRMTEPLARRRLKMSHDGAAGTQAPQNVA